MFRVDGFRPGTVLFVVLTRLGDLGGGGPPTFATDEAVGAMAEAGSLTGRVGTLSLEGFKTGDVGADRLMVCVEATRGFEFAVPRGPEEVELRLGFVIGAVAGLGNVG